MTVTMLLNNTIVAASKLMLRTVEAALARREHLTAFVVECRFGVRSSTQI
jgi:hypothetical protein